MTTLKNTRQNNAKVSGLKIVKETQWVEEVTHDTIDNALTAINSFYGLNSKWYKPVAVTINGVKGIFMLNEDGGLNFESRIIETDKGYKTEHLTNDGYDSWENKYVETLMA